MTARHVRILPAPEAPTSDYGRCAQVARILRLMHMVQNRTYLPPLPHLAAHLGVCTRTVRRDLDVLRSLSIPLPSVITEDGHPRKAATDDGGHWKDGAR